MGPDDVDRPNDVLGQFVAWRGLRREDEHPWHHIEVGVLHQPTIKGQNMQQIEMLTFVFVQSFDLHIE